MESFSVIADFEVDGVESGTNFAAKFTGLTDSRWELRLEKPISKLSKGTLIVSVKDRQGNITKIVRSFSIDVLEK